MEPKGARVAAQTQNVRGNGKRSPGGATAKRGVVAHKVQPREPANGKRTGGWGARARNKASGVDNLHNAGAVYNAQPNRVRNVRASSETGTFSSVTKQCRMGQGVWERGVCARQGMYWEVNENV